MKFQIPIFRWAKRLLYFPFHLLQRVALFLDDRDAMKITSFSIKLLSVPEMLCEVESKVSLRMFYRSVFYTFWAGISVLSYFFAPPLSVDLFFGVIELSYILAASVFLYVMSYQVVEYFSPDDTLKPICADDVFCCAKSGYTKIAEPDAVGSRPKQSPAGKSTHTPGFKYSGELSPVKDDTEELHADIDAHNRRW